MYKKRQAEKLKELARLDNDGKEHDFLEGYQSSDYEFIDE